MSNNLEQALSSEKSRYYTLKPKDIVDNLQYGCEKGYFYAYFGRDNEYSFHYADCISNIIENIPHYNDLYKEDIYKNKFDLEWQIDFRCDEWIVFANKSIADLFYNELMSRLTICEDEPSSLEAVDQAMRVGDGGE